MMLKKLINLVLLLLSLKIITAILYCFTPIAMPQIWRQSDTMGVSMRYFSRWFQEELSGSFFINFLPAILQSGDFNGIMAMEFPILNIITAPFFYFGPYWGRVLTGLTIVFIVTCLIFYNAYVWKNIKIFNQSMSLIMILFPIFSFSYHFTFVFMPDFISVILCYIAIGLSWRNNNRNLFQSFISFVIASIGLLLKPTSIICFLILFLHPNCIPTHKCRKFCLNFLWIPFSIIIAIIYYTIGVKWISQFADTPTLFFVHIRSPINSFIEFLNIQKLFSLLNSRAFFPYAFSIVLLLSIINSILNKKMWIWKLWFVSCIQILAIGVLDGEHSFIHNYYYIGTAPIFALIFIVSLRDLKNTFLLFGRKINSYFIIIPIFSILYGVFYYENIHFDIRNLYNRNKERLSMDYEACKNLKLAHPEMPWDRGYVFRTPHEDFPKIGLCFGERTNSTKNLYGIYISKDFPKSCQQIDSLGRYTLVRCAN